MTTLHHGIHKERHDINASAGADENGDVNGDVDVDTWNLLRLNKVVFHSVLHTLANSKDGGLDAAMKAEEVMNLLQNLHENDFYNNGNSLRDDDGNGNGNNANDIHNRKDDDTLLDSGDLKPNIKTWSILLRCWTNAVNHSDDDGGEYTAQHAESLLQTMEEMYQNGEDV